MRTNFTKSQALGNDFIIIEDIERRFELKPSVVARLCDRHFGIGADGLMIVRPSSHADFLMLFHNPDGSQAEMCGNGIRCFAAYLYNHGLTSKNAIKIETKGGLREVFLLFKDSRLSATKVNMGRPTFKASDIPMDVDEHEFIDDTIKVNGDEATALVYLKARHLHADDPEGKELEAHKNKEDGKEGKDAFRCPGGAVKQACDSQDKAQKNA